MPSCSTIVTGGGRGIGAAISRRLATEGHDLVITYRQRRDDAEQVAEDVRRAGQQALVVQADTTDEESVLELLQQASRFGPPTGLVNNAGSVSAIGPLSGNDLDTIRRDLDVNLFGVIACIKHTIPHMTAAGGGAIVNISSAAATLGSPQSYVHYAAAKAAVDALTVGLSKELAGHHIRVNAVAPGTVWTEFHHDPQRPDKVATSIPMGRAGTPEEIAGAVAWLLSQDARYTTGAIIRVAGGL